MNVAPLCPGCRYEDEHQARTYAQLSVAEMDPADHDARCARGYPRKRRRRKYPHEDTLVVGITAHPRYVEAD